MPRKANITTQNLTDHALKHFWENGFHASSMDDLVKSTGATRHAIYGAFGGKKQMFLPCFQRYQDLVVSPAFTQVEQTDATLEQVATYFEAQINRAEETGLPGPGCFVANSATEVAPHDREVLAKVEEHNARLKRGFLNALRNETPSTHQLSTKDLELLAGVLVVFTNGLWSTSRLTQDGDFLRASTRQFLETIRTRISGP
ncbi:TetR/AcrR family transcriptional regulator [Pseudovibrio sp. Ad37]|uniref:TetR/AcrR family transcriptional regulator n=1 Tax=Pseudovibrio sp. Ad37 TaxID=989422 RepID=UPI0007AE5504|nr:TetR/AcrR family transcriptional regulator [Pseudovibrio sp. Ad37]KZL26458.1 HTH-type transcriptional repressor ComR [Pseudovibrio sp. Ad37]